jgi:hypothetical protein
MPDVAIGASGVVGIAIEAVEGTYQAPTKFIPIRRESLNWVQETVWRRPIKGVADIVGAADGNGRVEGDIEMEVFTDVMPYFLRASRGELVQVTTGIAPDEVHTYTFTPNHAATPPATLTILVERNEQVFAYLGCVVGSMEITVDEGLLVCTMSILGRDEEEQAAAVPTWDEEAIIGAGAYDIRIPANAASSDESLDTFSFTIDNGAEPQYRLNPDSSGARYISYGERAVTMTVDRDFTDRAEFAEFRALTAKAISVLATAETDRSVKIDMYAMIIDSFELELSGQGDLVRGSIQYQGIYSDADTASFEIEVKTGEDLGLAV